MFKTWSSRINCVPKGGLLISRLGVQGSIVYPRGTIDYKTKYSRTNLYLLGKIRIGLLCNPRTNLYLLRELGLDYFIVLVELPESNNRVKTTRSGDQNYKFCRNLVGLFCDLASIMNRYWHRLTLVNRL